MRARDAFWKHGSGGHALYVVPSRDLVVVKLGGRDDQYAEANTGFPPPVPLAAPRGPGGGGTVDPAAAGVGTLERVLQAVMD